MLKCFWRGLIPYFGGLAALGTRGTQTKFGVALSGEMRYQFLIHNGFFLNKQGWRTATHPERQRTEKQGFSQYPSGWCEARGYDDRYLNDKGWRKPPFIVEIPGFEPGQTEPKSVVLPLHHTSIHPGKDRTIFSICQICT